MKFSERGASVVLMENRRSVKQLAAILILGVAPLPSAASAAEVGGATLERPLPMMAKGGFANSPAFSSDGRRMGYLTN
ncbi:MAG TPA: hypothetical protein VLU46_06465, partial [Thermoanaerobaculia bacterium]|nr:hypothetical protein [Thermoanaerobaculia bacterium]